MFAKTILTLFAVTARVAVATPPACLLAAVKYVQPPRLHRKEDAQNREKLNKYKAPNPIPPR